MAKLDAHVWQEGLGFVGSGFDRLPLSTATPVSDLLSAAGSASPTAAPEPERACAPPAEVIDDLVCFTPDTRILTGHGERPIKSLNVGDRVVTRDHGLRPIRWIGTRQVSGLGRNAPVRVATGSEDGDDAGVLVSPRHRILYTGHLAEILFGAREVFIAADDLADASAAQRAPSIFITYIHILLDRHEVIYANGIACESFQISDASLTGADPAAREALFTVFPDLRSHFGRHSEAARLCLTPHEALSLRAYARADTLFAN